MIQVEGLSKDYGTVVAVHSLSFEAKAGEILGFLGPNGAGKTTTLRMLAGALGPSSGRVRIAGHDLAREPIQARRSLGYMPEAAPLYPELRVREYLMFRAGLQGVRSSERGDAVQQAMRRAHVLDVALVTIGHLSKGYRQRVALASVLLGNPRLYILDEPTAGLDPNQIREVRALIREIASTSTVIVSSHILSEIEELCDRAIVMHRGRVVAQGALADLHQGTGPGVLLVRARDPHGRALGVCNSMPGVERVTIDHDDAATDLINLTLEWASGPVNPAACEQLVARLVVAEVGVFAVQPRSARLEEIFAALTVDAAVPENTGAS